MRAICGLLGIAAIGLVAANSALAGDLIYGCWNRPTCGKYCKLVCETTKITVVGYGSKCDTICVPGPSRKGCKHCSVECCPADSCGPCGTMEGDVCCETCCKKDCCCEGAPAKLEICWRDWFACGCAKPRTIKLLTKYQAEKEICWYRWEVVDAADCGEVVVESGGDESAMSVPHVYKSAPADALPGDMLPVTEEEQATLAAYLPAEDADRTIQFAQAEQIEAPSAEPADSQSHEAPDPTDNQPEPPSLRKRLSLLFHD